MLCKPIFYKPFEAGANALLGMISEFCRTLGFHA